jgi:hypothetical protein
MTNNTCVSCRYFGREEKPIPADQTLDGKKRHLCKERGVYDMIYVAADRPACEYYEEAE